MLRLFTLLLLAAFALPAQDTFSGVERIVAMGDVHGDYDAFVSVLRAAGVIDQQNRWSGGKTHFVQTGDVVDRGPDSRKILDLIQTLEKQAPKAGGRVHSLMGNHEVMNMYGDLRYVVPAEFAAFKTADSERLRDNLWQQQIRDLPRAPSREEKRKWEAEHPLGWVEHRMQYGSDGAYGRWIRAKNMIVKINDSLFLHGGISPKYASRPITDLNNAVRNELKDFSKLRPDSSVLLDPDGPLWYRGLAQDPEPAILPHLQNLLTFHGVKRIVIGHTPTPGAVLPRLRNQVISIDVGLSAYYGSSRACLVIEGDKLTAVHRGQLIPLPAPDPAAFAAYVKQVAALEKPTSRLAQFAASGALAAAPE